MKTSLKLLAFTLLGLVVIVALSLVIFIYTSNKFYLNVTLLFSGVIIFVNILLALFLANLVRQIKDLTDITDQISAGSLHQRAQLIPSESHLFPFVAEISQLVISFNNMVNRLQLWYLGLERKAQEKNTQLAQKIAEVESEKAKDEAILNSLIDGMIVTDIHGDIIMMNAFARQLLGLRAGTPVGQKVFYIAQLYKSDGSALLRDKHPIFISLTYGQKWTEDVTIYRLDGTKAIIAMTSTVISRNNVRLGAIATLRDVTKEKEIDRMKTEFISLASHQLRTPLSAIKWFTEMLISGDAGKLNSEQEEFAKNVSQSTERMIQLVNSLLNISRIESGRIVVDPVPTDLRELVTGIVDDLKAKIEERQQSLAISVHNDLPKINLDPKLIGQVYLNLLTNAIKYTPKGGDIQVIISKKDDQVISQVSDNGYGIPKSEQEKIFQKFFRADNVIKIETDGTGLGLYLIKAIIESSGGKIWFASEERKGTTFWFSLPLSGMLAKKGEVSLDS